MPSNHSELLQIKLNSARKRLPQAYGFSGEPMGRTRRFGSCMGDVGAGGAGEGVGLVVARDWVLMPGLGMGAFGAAGGVALFTAPDAVGGRFC